MMGEYRDIAEFITLCRPKKIVEVGIGRDFSTLKELEKMTAANIIAVDISPSEGVLVDDITRPDMDIYKKSDVIYSIRPPPELYPYLIDIARKVKALLVIRPFSLDEPPKIFKLVNYKRAVLYIIDFRR